MARIFISYKRVDKEKVFSLKHRIEVAINENCWIDLEGIESDAQFKNVIIRAINESEIVLFMYSKAHSQINNYEKDWTIRELNFAAQKGKRIVFLNIDGTPLTDMFLFDYSTKQQIDATSEEALARLFNDLNKWLGNCNQQFSSDDLIRIQKKTETSILSSDFSTNIKNNQLGNDKMSMSEIDKGIIQMYEKIIKRNSYAFYVFQKGDEHKIKVEDIARKGYAEAEYVLGLGEKFLYGVFKDKEIHFKKAESWLLKATTKGHLLAMELLSEMYYERKDYQKCISIAVEAANKGRIKAAINLYFSYYRINNYSRYIEALKNAALIQKKTKDKTIHCPALTYGKELFEGNYIEKNFEEAESWIRVAVELSYDREHERYNRYWLGKVLFSLGKNKKALYVLSKSPGSEFGNLYIDRIEELIKEIKSASDWTTKLMFNGL